MKKCALPIIGLVALALAGNAMAACTWTAKGTSADNWGGGALASSADCWTLTSGTPAVGQTVPATGDSIVIPNGTKVWFDMNTDLVNVTIAGGVNGADNSIAASPIAIVHKWANVTVTGDAKFELADGRKQGSCTYEIGNLTISDNSQLYCTRFSAATKAEQTVPILKLGGDVTWATTQGFPIYPVNFGGTFYSMTKLEFVGTNTSTINLPGKSTEFCSVIVPAGKTVILKNPNFYLGKEIQSGVSENFQIFGTAKFDSPCFVWGDGNIVVKNGGVVGTNDAAGVDSAPWGAGPFIGSAVVFEAGSGLMFYGSTAQVSGALIPTEVDKLIVDKSGATVTLSADLQVKELQLLNGVLATGSHKLAGPQAGKLVQVNGTVSGTWGPYASVSDWSQF